MSYRQTGTKCMHQSTAYAAMSDSVLAAVHPNDFHASGRHKRKHHPPSTSTSTDLANTSYVDSYSEPSLSSERDQLSDQTTVVRSHQFNSTQKKRRQETKKSKQTDAPIELTSNHLPCITAASTSDYPHGWSQLNIDFIESITPFLPPREICYLHRTCHAWLHIADHIRTPHLTFPSLRRGKSTRKKAIISDLSHSLIRRHVKTLVLSQSVTPPELELVSQQLPRLHKLICSKGGLAYTTRSSWLFPPQLKELTATFDLKLALSRGVSPTAISNSVNQFLIGVSQINSITNLQITIPSIDNEWTRVLILPPINLQPLRQLAHSLSDLSLNISLTTDHMMVLRSLVNLVSLKMEKSQVTHQQLAVLLADPLTFRLEEFTLFNYCFSNEDVPLLKRLTSLTITGDGH